MNQQQTIVHAFLAAENVLEGVEGKHDVACIIPVQFSREWFVIFNVDMRG